VSLSPPPRKANIHSLTISRPGSVLTMSSTESKAPAQASQAAPVFSYAQAAKGRAAATGTSPSQATSGISTPAKESHSPMLTLGPSLSAAAANSEAAAEKVTNGTHEPVMAADPLGLSLDSESKSPTLINTSSTPASPSFGTASTSTLPKEDDLALHASSLSESTWDRNTNGSDKGGDADARRSKKGKKKSSEKEESESLKEEEKKPEVLVAAPPPMVNIWQQRREAQALKVKPSPTIAQGSQAPAEASNDAAKLADAKKKAKATDLEGEKPASAAQNGSKDASSTKSKKGSDGAKGKDDASNKRAGPRGSRVAEREEKSAASQLPPPVEDAISWPAPETAIEQEKRRAQEEKERSEREKEDRDETASNKPRAKEKWVTVPYVPTVNFSTPLPPRGGRGRGGGRGGRDGAGRGDKANNTSSTTASPSDAENRGRGMSTTSRAASLPPSSNKRHSTDIRPQGKFTTTAEKAKAGQPTDGRRTSAQMETFDSQEQLSRGDAKGEQATYDENGVLQAGGQDQKGDMSRGPDQAAQFNKENNIARDGRADRGRGGYRGRGGHNGYQNGQQHPPQVYTNGHSPQPPNGFVRQNSTPFSPSMSPAGFGNQFTPSGARGGRVGPRSQSIPNNNMFGRFPPNVGPQPLSMIQTPSMFDYQPMQPMSALPYHSYVDQFSVLAMVSMQLEYYFSIDNLCKDVFLRKHMDSQGFVFLSFIADFKRIQALTKDLDMLRFACQESEVIDIIKGEDNLDRVRRMEGWEKWVLTNMDERDPSVRNGGPTFHRRAQRPQTVGPMMMPSPHPMSPGFSPTSTEPFQPYPNGAPLVPMNGNGVYQPETPLSAAVPDFAPSAVPINGAVDPLEAETTFFDEDVANLKLVFASSKGAEASKQTPYHSPSARTFSNGSIDRKALTEDAQEDRQGRGLTNGSHVPET
jgi:la-related protein 1